MAAVDISDAQAQELFDEHVSAKIPLGYKEVFRYPKGTPQDWKRSPAWADIHKQRHFLTDVLTRTRGRCIRARLFTLQLFQYLQKKGACWAYSDVEAITYRARAMISQLRGHRRSNPGAGAPLRWPHFGALLEMIDISPPAPSQVMLMLCCMGMSTDSCEVMVF